MEKRVFLIVLDSFGIGAEPDAAAFGDAGTNTLGAIAKHPNFHCPNLQKLGLFNIDGVTAGPISRHYPANGRYSVIFERDDAFLEQIEKINWAKPTMQRLSEDANEQGLPEGYGFKVVDIKYNNSGRYYTVELQTASQYLGDVTQYQEQIAELESAAAEKDSIITEQAAQLARSEENLSVANAQLAEVEAAYDDN